MKARSDSWWRQENPIDHSPGPAYPASAPITGAFTRAATQPWAHTLDEEREIRTGKASAEKSVLVAVEPKQKRIAAPP